MILLWGLASDRPLASVREQLARLGRSALLLDQRAVLETTLDATIDGGATCVLEWNGVRLDLDHVSAAYLRPYDPYGVPAVASLPADADGRRHAGLVYEGVRLWGDVTGARIVNRLAAMGSNNSKPYQAELIRAAGFAVPDTLVTTEPDAVVAFCAQYDQVIYKSISGTRSIVSKLSAPRKTDLDHVIACPTQFQQYVPGIDYRVHVVGDEVFVCELVSSADDYRYADKQGGATERRQSEIPDAQAAQCVSLAREIGLPVAGIDLRRSPDGEWFCFEVNPSPAFSWFDAPDHRIASSIAQYLAA